MMSLAYDFTIAACGLSSLSGLTHSNAPEQSVIPAQAAKTNLGLG